MAQREVRSASVVQPFLDEEFVRLPVAAQIAYSHIMRSAPDARDATHTVLVGIALSTVAPIYRDARGGSMVPLSHAELQELLFRPLRAQGGQPSLDTLCIRRQDLLMAIATLREARLAFNYRHGGLE